MRKTLEEFISSLYETDKKAQSKDIQTFVKKTSWFDFESVDRKYLVFTTRRHGDTEEETPGTKDVKEAKKLKEAILKTFDVRSIEIEVIDEWVSLIIEL